MSIRLWSPAGPALVALSVLTATATAGGVGEKGGGEGVARCVKVGGVLLRRQGPDGPWQAIRRGESVPADDLLVALPDAELLSADGAVQMYMLVDIAQRGPLPVLESAARLHRAKGVDLDLTLERGIVGFANVKKKGPARVRVRFHGQTWVLTLREPGTKVGMEIYGRHAPGLPHIFKGSKAKDDPDIEVLLLVVEGRAALLSGDSEITLEAPPGSTLVHWDSVTGMLQPRELDKLPPAIKPSTPNEIARYKAACNVLRQLVVLPVGPTIDRWLDSPDAQERRIGTLVAGAVDDLPRLAGALFDNDDDVRDLAIVVARAWIGRGPGQSEKFYKALLARKDLNEVAARGILFGLYGFTDEQRRDPATYELLIESLKSPRLAIRELARWHLVRLVPEGAKIGYDADAPEAERERAYQEWRRLIPPGRLPPGLATEKKKK